MIVIDTEMPTCCEGCFARQEYYNPRFDETEYNCGINGENLGTHSRQDLGEWHCDKPEWCPLKEQEPVKPDGEYSGDGTTWWNVCGACRTAINPNDKYCHECGREVKWND